MHTNHKRHRMLWGQVLVFVFLVIVLPFGVGEQASQTHLDAILQAPSWQHWFGTDAYGRDVFLRVWNAGSVSVGMSVVMTAVAYSIGLVLGMVAGFIGGRVDRVLMSILDLFLAFPSLLIAITVAGVLGGGLVNGVFALVLAYTPYYAKLARTQVLQLRQADYVMATYMTGAPAAYRMWTLVRNIQTPLIVYASVNIGSMILSLSTLSFLGIGVTVPQAEWGAMLNEGRNLIEQAPWLIVFPGLAVTGTILYLNQLGRRIQHLLGGV